MSTLIIASSEVICGSSEVASLVVSSEVVCVSLSAFLEIISKLSSEETPSETSSSNFFFNYRNTSWSKSVTTSFSDSKQMFICQPLKISRNFFSLKQPEQFYHLLEQEKFFSERWLNNKATTMPLKSQSITPVLTLNKCSLKIPDLGKSLP